MGGSSPNPNPAGMGRARGRQGQGDASPRSPHSKRWELSHQPGALSTILPILPHRAGPAHPRQVFGARRYVPNC